MNILGDYQVWLGVLNQEFGASSRRFFMDSFDTQEEAMDYIEQNYTLYAKPKWSMANNTVPRLETALKKAYKGIYDAILIAPKSSVWHSINDVIMLNGSIQMNDVFFDINKKGTVTKVEIINNDTVRWKVEFEIFNETAYKYITLPLGNWTGPGTVEIINR